MIETIRKEIIHHPSNKHFTELGYTPLFSASSTAKIVIIGQAPGRKAQESNLVWNDASGLKLIKWLGISENVFRDTTLFAHVPMDFYYPGKGISGDLPPRQDFAPRWHEKLLDQMPHVQLKILIGNYAQRYYLKTNNKVTLTDTVRNFETYIPTFFPLVHPSPLNFRWHSKNTWYETDLVPELQKYISTIVDP